MEIRIEFGDLGKEKVFGLGIEIWDGALGILVWNLGIRIGEKSMLAVLGRAQLSFYAFMQFGVMPLTTKFSSTSKSDVRPIFCAGLLCT